MACLASINYDPATQTTAATSSLLAMTAIDTTNLRNTFNAPANGKVLVRLRTCYFGAATAPMVLLGVLGNLAGGTGTNVLGRQCPLGTGMSSQATSSDRHTMEASFLVTGLTAGVSYSFDAAYGVEFAVASSTIGWGGPNDTTANNAAGSFSFDVYDTQNLLAGTMYDPSTAAGPSTGTATVVTAFDTTNLRLTFTTPGSGLGSSFVLVRSTFPGNYANAAAARAEVMGAVLDGSTVKGRQMTVQTNLSNSGPAATDRGAFQYEAVIGVSPNTSYTWDLAYAVERVAATTNIKYGGPNNTTQDDAWGGVPFEVWAV